MVNSMTGYGCARGTSGKLDITVEVRSVNNRFLDCSIRIPRVYTAVEDKLKSVVQKHVTRGKVDVYVTIDTSKADDITISVNESLAESYMAAFSLLSEKYGIGNDITAVTLSRMQDVLTIEKKETDTEQLGNDLCEILDSAMTAFDDMRRAEGEKLRGDILSRAEKIEALVGIVEKNSPKTVEQYRQRLYDRISEVLESKNIDESRILTEVAVFADKIAVDEETVRLRSHISQLRDIMQLSEPVGRKLDFLIQEFNREANTIGSKCSDVEISKIVVDIKSEIEKIREQIQNLE